MEILDTNVLVRFLVADNQEQYEQAVTWFKEAEVGKREIVVSSLVVAETCFVLESVYHQPKEAIAKTLGILLGQRWLRVPERKELLVVWKWYRQGEHFVDSFLLAWKEVNQGTVLRFDKKVLRKGK